MVSNEMDFYVDVILQMISLIAYSTIIIRTTWIFVPNRFPKLPADKKWPRYVITFFYVLAILILLTSSGFYYLDDSKDFGDDFRKMDRVIEDIEIHFNSTTNRLAEIGNPEINLEKLKEITEDIKNRTGFGIIEREKEVWQNSEVIMNGFYDWIRSSECIKERSFGVSKKSIMNIKEYLNVQPLESIDIMEKFNSINTKLLESISNHKKELVNHERIITNHLQSVNTFFGKMVYSLKESKMIFNRRKEDSMEEENSKNIVLLLPFSFTILFALLSIITIVLWEKDVPRVLSIIRCILFYFISIQIVVISTYFAYNVLEDIFIKEPDYFKLFDFEITSYDKKSITNAYKQFLACDDENSAMFCTIEKWIHIQNHPLLRDFQDNLLKLIKNDLSDRYFLSSTRVSETKSYFGLFIQALTPVGTCVNETERKRQEYSIWLNEMNDNLGLWLEFINNEKNKINIARTVIEEKMEYINRTIYEPIRKINQTLFDSNLKCHLLYNALLNGYISSYQPEENSYRNMFKISVMGCSTLCLVLYLLAFGRRIQATIDSKPSTGSMDTGKKSAEAKKSTKKSKAPRSPNRF